MLSLKSLYRSGIPSKFIRHRIGLLHDSAKNVFAVVEELVQLSGSLQHLSASVDEFSKICPGVIQSILPLGNGGSISVSGSDETISNLVDCSHSFVTNGFCVVGKFSESLPQKSHVFIILVSNGFIQNRNVSPPQKKLGNIFTCPSSWEPATTSRSANHCSKSSTSLFNMNNFKASSNFARRSPARSRNPAYSLSTYAKSKINC